MTKITKEKPLSIKYQASITAEQCKQCKHVLDRSTEYEDECWCLHKQFGGKVIQRPFHKTSYQGADCRTLNRDGKCPLFAAKEKQDEAETE